MLRSRLVMEVPLGGRVVRVPHVRLDRVRVDLPLPGDWWADRQYVDALLHWHRDAWLTAYSSLQFGTSRLVGRPVAFHSVDELRRAEAAYETELEWAATDASRRAA